MCDEDFPFLFYQVASVSRKFTICVFVRLSNFFRSAHETNEYSDVFDLIFSRQQLSNRDFHISNYDSRDILSKLIVYEAIPCIIKWRKSNV